MKARFPFAVAAIMVAALRGCLIAVPGMAQDLKMCVGEAPGQSVPIEGQEGAPLPFIELVKAIGAEYTGGRFEYEAFPFVRSLQNVVNGRCDFHYPLINFRFFVRPSLHVFDPAYRRDPICHLLSQRATNHASHARRRHE